MLLLSGTILVYTGCKKTETQTKPAITTNQVDNKAVAAQIAMNLYKSFSSDSAGSSFKTATSFTGKAASNGINMLCGFTKDTTYTFSSVVDGLTSTGNSVISETFNCNGATVNGYTMADSTITSKHSATLLETTM